MKYFLGVRSWTDVRPLARLRAPCLVPYAPEEDTQHFLDALRGLGAPPEFTRLEGPYRKVGRISWQRKPRA